VGNAQTPCRRVSRLGITMLALHTQALTDSALNGLPLKVLAPSEAFEAGYPYEQVAVDLRAQYPVALSSLAEAGFGAVVAAHAIPGSPLPVIHSVKTDQVIAPGDVIRVRGNGMVSVLYRRGANASSLLVTEQCNSHCLMCSQPPRLEADRWRIDEILKLIPLIDRNVPALALTGGEPTLLGGQLTEIIERITTFLPQTQVNILTNGRLLADVALADRLTEAARNVLWAIPVYGHTAARHDFVVQAMGAFDATLNGIYNLAERQAAIEIRVVLHRQTVGRLKALADFIWRTMPFAAHVTFMGLEPMGYAKVNRELLYLDPLDYRDELAAAVWYLHDRGIHTSIYNTPLCVLPREVWPLARQSISDWKNAFIEACDGCAVKHACSGFFASAGEGWRSRAIAAIKGEVCPCPGIGENLCGRCLVGRGQVPSCSPEEQRPR